MQKLIVILFLIISFSGFSQKGKKSFELELYFNRKISETERVEIKDKIYQYSQLLHTTPGDPVLFIQRGTQYAQLGLFPDAITDYNKAINLDSTIAEAYFNRGLARARFAFTKGSCLDVKKSASLGLSQGKDLYNKHCEMYKPELGEIK
jgi:tetratricopeptide (TPR) repeat protein